MTGNQNQAILKSLPLLAGILGKSYGIRVEIGGKEAYTNGSVIHLPNLPEESDPDFMGLVRGYIDHESAHIRETDFSIIENMIPIEKHIWNILEDWRVEKKLAAVFPGCRQNFKWLIRHMFAVGGGGGHEPVDSSVVILNWLLLSVRSWDVAEVGVERDHLAKILDTRWPGLKAEVEEVLEQVQRYCPDSFACLRYANLIMDILTMWAEREELAEDGGEQEQNPSGGGRESAGSETKDNSPSVGGQGGTAGEDDSPSAGQESSDSEGEDGNPSAGKEGSDSEGQDGSPSAGGQDGTADSDSSGSSMDSLDEQAAKGSYNSHDSGGVDMDLIPLYEADLSPEKIGWLLSALESELPEDLGNSIAKSIESQAASSVNRVEVASIGPKELLEFDPEDILEIRAVTSGMRTRFHALFQSMKQVRSTPSRTGKINTRNLFTVAQGNPKVFLRHGNRQGINTAVHILLDSSASMRRRISLASRVCHAVAQTLELVGINTGVTAFPGESTLAKPDGLTVAPMVRHGQVIHNKFNINVKGSTPMGEALWWVLQEMVPLKESRKVVLVITDGMPDCMKMAVRAIDAGAAMGVEFYAIGIDSPVVHSLLPDSSVNISNLDELAQAVFTMLGRTFKQAN